MAELQPISIQQLVRASDNANALDAFVNADASTMVFRPAADPIESLEYWRDYMRNLSQGKDGEGFTFDDLTQAQKDEITGADGIDGSYTLKAYSNYDLMVADAANIPADTSVNVTNDTDTTKNGMYVYDGTAFTKSAYDPLLQAKSYTDTQISGVTKPVLSTKNLFNPNEIVAGSSYSTSGTVITNPGATYRRTPKYPCVAGETISISGMDGLAGTLQRNMHFWNGETLVQLVAYSDAAIVTTLIAQVPAGATSFSLNVNSAVIPPKLQIEKSIKPTSYESGVRPDNGLGDSYLGDVKQILSSKNLYNGKFETGRRPSGRTGVAGTSNINDIMSSFVPVEFGKYYTISGLDLNLFTRSVVESIYGFSSDKGLMQAPTFMVKGYIVNWGVATTIYIDDPAITHITFPLSTNGLGTLAQAKSLSVQVEEGKVATTYEPQSATQGDIYLYNQLDSRRKQFISASNIKPLNQFIEMNRVRNEPSVLTLMAKDVAPNGISYAMESIEDSASNNLFMQVTGLLSGKKELYATLSKSIGGTAVKGFLSPKQFTVPSGSLDNPNTLITYADGLYSKAGYVHPDIAYDAVGVAGFKYWMIASILPVGNMGDTQWEDEDVFVSNDATNWQRIQSLYETDKTYTAASLRLPPHNLARANARQFAILPCPASGDTIEVSMPADNGAAAIDRQTVTLTGLPWKHDPAILIDGGYVYTYHTYHLPYAGRPSGTNRFVVCVRTNDGINWDVVRNDGSTMRITEANSRTLFTKDAQGRYNFMYYGYSRSNSNPTVIKWGEGDYELYYGNNYEYRVKGTTPYNFDFSNMIPMAGVGGHGNHPFVIRNGSTLYLINNKAIYSSTDRGVTLTKMAHYPLWLGGVSGMHYKKSMCVGEGGKLIVADVQRYYLQDYRTPVANGLTATNDENLLFLYEYPSLTDFINKANNGLVDAYIDVQIAQINYTARTRSFISLPAISSDTTAALVNRSLQRVKIADIDIKEGDVLFVYVTLNSRNGAKITFSGLDIA